MTANDHLTETELRTLLAGGPRSLPVHRAAHLTACARCSSEFVRTVAQRMQRSGAGAGPAAPAAGWSSVDEMAAALAWDDEATDELPVITIYRGVGLVLAAGDAAQASRDLFGLHVPATPYGRDCLDAFGRAWQRYGERNAARIADCLGGTNWSVTSAHASAAASAALAEAVARARGRAALCILWPHRLLATTADPAPATVAARLLDAVDLLVFGQPDPRRSWSDIATDLGVELDQLEGE